MTYLAPGLPAALFHCLAAYLARKLRRRVVLKFEESASGPVKGGVDPFSAEEADVSWMCSPSYLWMREAAAPVELVPAGFVFRDARARGLPVYFSEVIVHRESTLRSFSDLRGTRWAYNDPCSLSGYQSLLRKLAELGEDTGFFSELRCSGGHLQSFACVGRAEAEAAAIDSNVLALARTALPGIEDQVRVLEARRHSLERSIRHCGLSRQKARAIQSFLRHLISTRGRLSLRDLRRPDLDVDGALADLCRADGVGVKTAAITLMFACGADLCAVDTHLLRILRRLAIVPEKAGPERAFRLLRPLVPAGRGIELHLRLIQLGRSTCKSQRPRCGECPLRRLCPHGRRRAAE